MRRTFFGAVALVVAVSAGLVCWYVRDSRQPNLEYRPPSPYSAAVAANSVSSRASAANSPALIAPTGASASSKGENRSTDSALTDLNVDPCDLERTATCEDFSPSTTRAVRPDGKESPTRPRLASWLDDSYVREAFGHAYGRSPLWRKVADAVAARGTKVRWESLSAEINGMFDPSRNVIVLNSDLRSEQATVLAATMAHEIYHASHEIDSSIGATLQEEINAYGWEAYVWSRLPKSPARTAREAYLDDLVKLWQSRELHKFVVTMPAFQRSLFGRVLESP